MEIPLASHRMLRCHQLVSLTTSSSHYHSILSRKWSRLQNAEVPVARLSFFKPPKNEVVLQVKILLINSGAYIRRHQYSKKVKSDDKIKCFRIVLCQQECLLQGRGMRNLQDLGV